MDISQITLKHINKENIIYILILIFTAIVFIIDWFTLTANCSYYSIMLYSTILLSIAGAISAPLLAFQLTRRRYILRFLSSIPSFGIAVGILSIGFSYAIGFGGIAIFLCLLPQT